MPLPRGARVRAKRISPTKFVRVVYKNNKIIESKIMKYKKPRKRRNGRISYSRGMSKHRRHRR